MKSRPARINCYLLAVAGAGLLAVGCATGEKDEKHQESSIRLHIEVSAVEAGNSTNALVGRSSPVPVTVSRDFFLSEFHTEAARVVDALGGFSIALQFNPEGTHLLEQYTTIYRGRRAGILAEFGQIRWIAAPILQSRITNGQFIFTPDTTREEAERIVRGLNRVAELVRKGRK